MSKRLRKSIADIRIESWEAGHRCALETIIAVMDETRKIAKEPIAALDVRGAIDSFADQFIEFIQKKLLENSPTPEGTNGTIQ